MPSKKLNSRATPYEEQLLRAHIEIVRRLLKHWESTGIVLGRDANARSEWTRRGLSIRQRDCAVEMLVNLGEVKLETSERGVIARLVDSMSSNPQQRQSVTE
jgi:hypothetical protein